MTVAVLCERARGELACLGDLGAPLLQMVGVVESVAGDRDADVLDDPLLALEVLLAAGDADPAVVGRVLDYLRARAGTAPAGRLPAASASGGRHLVRVADAIATYEAGALALLAKGTQHTYRPLWSRMRPSNRMPQASTCDRFASAIVRLKGRRASLAGSPRRGGEGGGAGP